MVNRQWSGAAVAKAQQRTLVLEIPRIAVSGRIVWLVAAGLGFFWGYVWAVTRWGVSAGLEGLGGDALFSASAAGGVLATMVYVALLGLLFFPKDSTAQPRRGVDGFAPLFFIASFVVGTAGIRSIFWVLGC